MFNRLSVEGCHLPPARWRMFPSAFGLRQQWLSSGRPAGQPSAPSSYQWNSCDEGHDHEAVWKIDGHEVARGFDVWIDGPVPGSHEIELSLAGAVSTTIRTTPDATPGHWIGNRRSKELHDLDCRWVARMSNKNVLDVSDLDEALGSGFNGCYYLPP